MDVDTRPGLAELINRQLGVRPETPLPRGVEVEPDVLWFWVGVEMATIMGAVFDPQMAPE